MITIIAVGKKHEPHFVQAIDSYKKRLRPPFDVKWSLIPHSAADGDAARQHRAGDQRRDQGPPEEGHQAAEAGPEGAADLIGKALAASFPDSGKAAGGNRKAAPKAAR